MFRLTEGFRPLSLGLAAPSITMVPWAPASARAASAARAPGRVEKSLSSISIPESLPTNGGSSVRSTNWTLPFSSVTLGSTSASFGPASACLAGGVFSFPASPSPFSGGGGAGGGPTGTRERFRPDSLSSTRLAAGSLSRMPAMVSREACWS